MDFKELREKIGDDKTDLTDDTIDEGFLRNVSAIAVVTKIFNLSKRVKSSKDIGKKLDLIASQNTLLGALGLAVGKFLKKRKR